MCDVHIMSMNLGFETNWEVRLTRIIVNILYNVYSANKMLWSVHSVYLKKDHVISQDKTL